MSVIATQHRTAMLPVSAEERAEVMQELQAILSHPLFKQSKRYPALLRYLVEHTLRGDTAHIKERTLGIEVFGREATYDTTNDTIVRFTASEVRRRLATFYNQHAEHAIHIALPVGSYIPEFLREDAVDAVEAAPPQPTEPASGELTDVADVHAAMPLAAEPAVVSAPSLPVQAAGEAPRARPRWMLFAGVVAALLLLCLAALAIRSRFHLAERTAVDRFWYPLTVGEQSPVLIAGGNVFSTNPYSGTETAGREVDYPFVSMQIASAMVRVSGILQKEGRAVDVLAANTTTLSDLRDRPLVLVGGYNNAWTGQLTGALPIRLESPQSPAFREADGAGRVWRRDSNRPYSEADDYALIGRFRSATTDSVVVLMAGLGRNGSEAASQFLTDPHRLQALEQQVGHRLDGENFEAVLQVPVIQGRTGAPKVLALRRWN